MDGGFAFKKEDFQNTGIEIIRISNILKNGTIDGEFAYHPSKEELTKYMVEKGEFLIAMSGATTGKIGKANKKMYVNQRVGIFREKEASDLNFVGQILKKPEFQNYIEDNWGAGAQPNISLNQLRNYEFKSPRELEEQSKISLMLQHIDTVISLREREQKGIFSLKLLFFTVFCKKRVIFKENNLLTLFCSLSNKRVSKNKHLRLKIVLFCSFTYAWELKSLGNLYVLSGSGGTPLTQNKDYYENGTINFLTISDVSNSGKYIFETEKKITNLGLKNSTAWIVPKNSISFAMYASVGKVCILGKETATSQAFFNMKFANEELTQMIYYKLKLFELTDFWTSLISTGTQGNLNSEKIKNLSFMLPRELEEQSKISLMLQHIDTVISLRERELKFCLLFTKITHFPCKKIIFKPP
ncbi:restriction endonuclease subunit S [Mycoplasma procyoni]|uniref:restriction endonuclease subunit S n=1 Tax=Mycoplasma procyoni TaxID=568784 RepID=UPI00358F388B